MPPFVAKPFFTVGSCNAFCSVQKGSKVPSTEIRVNQSRGFHCCGTFCAIALGAFTNMNCDENYDGQILEHCYYK